MNNKIVIILILILSGCRHYDSERKGNFLENEIEELVVDADRYFENGDYQLAFETYQKALNDYRILVTRTKDILSLNSFILDTLEINNKMEVSRIGSLIK